jgi:hypothetical protein
LLHLVVAQWRRFENRMKTGKPMGRPSSYTPEIGTEICERMAEGKGLRQICEAEDMPHRTTVMRWIEGNEGFRDQYARARDAMYDWIAEEIIRISDDASGDYFIEDRDGKSIVVPDHARVQRSRLQVDSRKWLLSKLSRRYADKPQMDDEPKQLTVRWQKIEHVIVSPGDDHAQRYEAPRQIAYQPPELPADLSERDWSLLMAVLEKVKARTPADSEKPPGELLEAVGKAIDALYA